MDASCASSRRSSRKTLSEPPDGKQTVFIQKHGATLTQRAVIAVVVDIKFWPTCLFRERRGSRAIAMRRAKIDTLAPVGFNLSSRRHELDADQRWQCPWTMIRVDLQTPSSSNSGFNVVRTGLRKFFVSLSRFSFLTITIYEYIIRVLYTIFLLSRERR